MPKRNRATTSPKRQTKAINLRKIVVVTKDTKIQYDQRRWKLPNERALVTRYRQGAEDIKRIIDSHRRQLAALSLLKKFCRHAKFVNASSLRRSKLKGASLVIAFGGDNHFQYVSHFVDAQIPLAGVNSDPLTSTGALLSFTTESFLTALPKLELGKYKLEAWTRLSATLNGIKLGPVTCELFVGQRYRDLMSRHTLHFKGYSVEQKSSGMLISTGAGSTGWFGSAIRAIHPNGLSFPRTAMFARFVLTELASSVKIDKPHHRTMLYREGLLAPRQKLVIHSLNRPGGIVSVDALRRYKFERGSTLTVGIDPNPLKVLSLH